MKITPCTYAETMAIFDKAIDDDNKVIHELRKSVRNAEISLDARKLALRRAEARLADRIERYRAFKAGELKSFDLDVPDLGRNYEP